MNQRQEGTIKERSNRLASAAGHMFPGENKKQNHQGQVHSASARLWSTEDCTHSNRNQNSAHTNTNQSLAEQTHEQKKKLSDLEIKESKGWASTRSKINFH
jgi:hypothetical protein